MGSIFLNFLIPFNVGSRLNSTFFAICYPSPNPILPVYEVFMVL